VLDEGHGDLEKVAGLFRKCAKGRGGLGGPRPDGGATDGLFLRRDMEFDALHYYCRVPRP